MNEDRVPKARPRPRARVPAWSVLLVAALLEVLWALALKEAGGLARPGWAVFGIAVAMLSLGMLSFALRDLPVGGAYAVWVGIGAVGVALAGMAFLGESTDPLRLVFLGLILVGVVGLSLTERPAAVTEDEPESKGVTRA